MSISELIIWIIGFYLFGVLVFKTIESVKTNHYKRKLKKIEKKKKKALDEYYKQRKNMKFTEKYLVIDKINDIDEQQELEDFIADVNDAGFDIDEEEALQYISEGKSSEDYVTYMEDFYKGDDNISNDDYDDNVNEKAEDYINDMSSLGYDITDDEAKEMAEEGFDPEDYAEEYEEENRDNY